MIRYIGRRLLMALPVLLGTSFLIFAMVYALPGDPIRALAGDQPLPPEVVAQLRAEHNLDDPLLWQYVQYLGQLFQGNLGTDFAGNPVSETIGQRLPITARLAIVAIIFEILFGVTAGVLCALYKNSWFDNLVLVSTTMVVSIPVFVLAFLAQWLFGFQLGWFPVAGIANGWFSLILPGLVLAALSMAYVARLTRTSMVETLGADHVRTARSKGITELRVVTRHGLRNALIPVVTFIGADLGAMMGGAIVTESVFNIPGIGRAVFDAVRNQEGPVVVGIVTMMVFFFIFFNLVVDVLYGVLDPRIRYE